MSLLAANRRALVQRFPEVLKLLEAVAPAAARTTPVAAEPSSLVDEVRACRRLCLVFTGIPDPATARAILSAAPTEILFWCIEPDPAPLGARLAREDCSAWLIDPRVFVSVGIPSVPEIRRLNRELAWIDSARAYFLPSRYSGQESVWKPILVGTLARIQQRWQNVLTDLTLTPARWENTCTNLPAFLDSPGIECLAGAFARATLVLVAAGPSLDDALPFLHQVAPHALIVTGNTSFRALAAHGLCPHLTVTVDPFPATDLGYAGQPLGDTHLIAPVFANSAVVRRFKGRLFGMGDQSPLLARLRRASGQPPAPALLGDATVSTTIINLASFFGCQHVVFVGQDFAIADDGRTHASETFYTDLGCNRQDSEKVHRVRGNTRDEVTVPARHLWYLRTVEGLVARTPNIRFLNTSHRGAMIAGAPFVDYDSAAAEIAAGPQVDFRTAIAKRHGSHTDKANRAAIAAELDHAKASMNEALRLSLAAALANELALADPTTKRRQQFDLAAQRFEHWRTTHQAEQSLLFEGRTKPEVFAAERRRIALPKDIPDRPLREAGELAWAFAEGAADVARQLAEAPSGNANGRITEP